MSRAETPPVAPDVVRHGRSSLELRHGIKYIRLNEDDFYRTGFACGRLLLQSGEPMLRLLSHPFVRAGIALLNRGCRRHWDQLRVPDRYRDEIRGYADATGIPFEHLFFLNFCFDVLKRYGFHCSTLAVFDAQTTLVGRNTDLLPMLARFALKYCTPMIVDVAIPGQNRFSHVSVPLFVGALNGFNEAGVAVNSHQIIHAAERPSGPRLASSLLMRMLLEKAASLADAHGIIAGNLSMRSLNIVVVSHGSRKGAVFEVHPERFHAVHHDGNFACTTHFESDTMRPLHDGVITPSQTRLASMRAMLAENHQPDHQTLLGWLRDCRNGPEHRLSGRSVSNHGTYQSFLFDLGQRCVLLSNGRKVPVSSSGEFVPVRVNGPETRPFDVGLAASYPGRSRAAENDGVLPVQAEPILIESTASSMR